MGIIRKNLFIIKSGIVLFLTLSQSMSFAVQKATVSVIFSSDAEPYRQSYDGFKSFFDENKVALQVFEHNLEKENSQAIYSGTKTEKPDLIFAVGTRALESALENKTDIPVVFSMVLNPGTIAEPNVCGVSLDISAEVKLKQFKTIFPEKKNIGLIYSPQSELIYENIVKTCKNLGFNLVSKKISSKTEFSEVLESISSKIDCFLMTPDTDIYYPKLVEYLLRESLKNNFSVIGLSSTYVKAGALVAFDCDYKDIGNQAGELALKILEDEKPTNIRCVGPRKTKLSLNLMTAKLLGMKIPPEILTQANEVFGK